MPQHIEKGFGPQSDRRAKSLAVAVSLTVIATGTWPVASVLSPESNVIVIVIVIVE